MRAHSGVVLIAVMLFIAIAALGASGTVQVATNQTQRERERQLLFVGDQYRRALVSYYSTIPPGGSRSLPATLDELLNDSRFPTPIQHLRRKYPDPFTGKTDWVLIMNRGGISGVHSRSDAEPLKSKNFAPRYAYFEGTTSYAEWVFTVGTL